MRLILLIFSFVFTSLLMAQSGIRINEVCSRNASVIADEDGEKEDWIEIYNADTLAINLSSFYLSDDKDQALMWRFPNMLLNPHEYLLIFASKKDRKPMINHWETALFGDSLWKYKNPNAENESDYDYVYWSDEDYDDTNWEVGPGAFGLGYENIATETSDTLRSIYLRQEFNINDTSKILSVVLHAYYDDGFTAYLNGYELFRINMIEDGIKPLYKRTAFSPHPSHIDSGEAPEAFYIEPKLWKSLLKNGRNVLAIQDHNFWNQYPMVIKAWLSFSVADSIYQTDSIAPLLHTRSLPLHTNFSIKSEGENIYLNDSLGNRIQKLSIPALPTDISMGSSTEFPDSLVFFTRPTPGYENDELAKSGIINDSIITNYSSGNYNDSIRVSVQNIDTNFIIRYTLDGSLPRDTALLYDTSIIVDSTMVLRFRYFCDSLIAGPVSNYTYFINDTSSLPTFSLITDPYNLWDSEYGIYVLGNHYTNDEIHFGANFWQDWERPVHIQEFSKDASLQWEQDAGIKIHGNYTRSIPQKSFGIYAKSRYATSRFNHALFKRKPYIKSVKRFLLRNTGNDFYRAGLRDLLIQTRMQATGIEIQSGQPGRVFLNGEYWGLYHLREKIDRYYLQDNCGANPDDLDLLEQNGLIVTGDRNEFVSLVDFVKHKPLSNEANYQYISSEIDIENWIDVLISNLYHFNTDWPHHNTKFWKMPGHKWRQILVDQDVTMGYRMNNSVSQNALIPIHEDTISYLAVFYQSLIKNKSFKRKYINRFADLMNTIFLPANYLPIVDSIVEIMTPEMPRHCERWNRVYNHWLNYHIPVVREFIEDRSPYMRNHLRNYYSLGANDTISLSVNPEGKGQIRLNTIFIKENNWSGLYFDSIPVRLEAIPNPGYEFVGWQSPTSPELADSGRIVQKWYLKSHDSIRALFYSPGGTEDTLQMAFTEINYRSFENAEAGDWLEIFNKEADTIDLSGWTLRGLKPYKKWEIPPGTSIAHHARLVLVQDSALFKSIHPEVTAFVGSFEWGINSEEEEISLWDELGRLVSKMSFSGKAPWPDNAFTSKSIELAVQDSDYHEAENWQLGCPGGSPALPPQDCSIESRLLFSEINYKSHPQYNSGDWVEILNHDSIPIDISHWIFRDGNADNSFVFPAESLLNPEERIIIAQDTTAFKNIQENIGTIYGPMGFGFSASGEQISLSNQFDQRAISLQFTNDAPWPDEASGSGYTIELNNANMNMQAGENWSANCFLGTPFGAPNWCIQPGSIIFSEIKYQSAPNEESGDWVELYNTNTREVDLQDWKMISHGDTINIDSSYILAASDYVVMASDTALFYQIYDSLTPSIAGSFFDLRKNEDALFILDKYRHPGDILAYNYLLDWPVFQTDTNNRTLELINYQNSLDPLSWRCGCDYGTPGMSPDNCDTQGLDDKDGFSYQILVQPNPTSGELRVEYELPQSENIEISLLNAQWNTVMKENLSSQNTGKHIINLHLQRLASGVYFLMIRGEKSLHYKKIMIIK
jgi:hypothetical protein